MFYRFTRAVRFPAFYSVMTMALVFMNVGCQTQSVTSVGKDSPTTANATVADHDEWPALKKNYLNSSRREHDHRIANWKTVAQWTFEDDKLPEEFTVFDGKWDVKDGQLRAIDGEVDRNRTLGIAACKWPAFRIAFDATLTARAGNSADRICDLGIRLNADPTTGSFAKGYVAILAQYANQSAVLYRLNVPFARTEFTPIRPGVKHRVMVEVVKPHIRVWVDDKVILEAWERAGTNNRDPRDFQEMDPQKIIAIHTYDTQLVVDNMTISVPDQAK